MYKGPIIISTEIITKINYNLKSKVKISVYI